MPPVSPSIGTMDGETTSSTVHPFYANDTRSTAYLTSPAVPGGAPDYLMSIVASHKFEKHSFEVRSIALSLSPALDATHVDPKGTSTSIPFGGEGGRVVRDTHAWRVACSVCSDVIWTPAWRRFFVWLVKILLRSLSSTFDARSTPSTISSYASFALYLDKCIVTAVSCHHAKQ